VGSVVGVWGWRMELRDWERRERMLRWRDEDGELRSFAWKIDGTRED
jgi:hypothetical protein